MKKKDVLDALLVTVCYIIVIIFNVYLLTQSNSWDIRILFLIVFVFFSFNIRLMIRDLIKERKINTYKE